MTAAGRTPTGDIDIALDFLDRLRPGGPWLLTAIEPDGPIETATAQDADAVRDFILKHEGRRNLYYSVNPTTRPLTSKASKKDIAAAEFLPADLDPRDEETPTEAKARYLERLATFEPRPTFVVDSGNGLQILWRLAVPVGPGGFATVEERTKAILLALGGPPGTQNVDRILRLPGTTNLPNEKKRKSGRVPCATALLSYSDIAHPLDVFPEVPRRDGATGSAGPKPNGRDGVHGDIPQDLLSLIREGARTGDRSDKFFHVVAQLKGLGWTAADITALLEEHPNGIAAKYAGRVRAEVERAYGKAQDFQTDKNNAVVRNSQQNIRAALYRLGANLRHDIFQDRLLIEGVAGVGPLLDDRAMARLWLAVDETFHFRPDKDFFWTVTTDAARRSAFHPVIDYLDSTTWDGTPRIDTWLTRYGGAHDAPYSRAVGRLMLVAAVRRVREPGCKFDELVVFECEQGKNKSNALALLAVNNDWFSDDLPLGAEGKRVIEALSGRWIVEAAELKGMRRGDIEHLKALLSRRRDRGRLSYDRLVSEYPRQCIFVGTTNATLYLRDTTGNRRFWPVKITAFDLDQLSRDRDQIWAEAAAREATGESIRLDAALWNAASTEQQARTVHDPFIVTLDSVLGDLEGKVRAEDVWTLLGVAPGNRTQDHNARLGEAMKDLGFLSVRRRFGGPKEYAYMRGNETFLINVIRDDDGNFYASSTDPGAISPSRIQKVDPTIKKTMLREHETDEAVLVYADGVAPMWLPKSQVKIEPKGQQTMVEITMPLWLAAKKGLAAGPVRHEDEPAPIKDEPLPF
jgi:hypothetical protein